MTDRIPLPVFSRALTSSRAAQTKKYVYCYKAAIDGRIAVIQGDNGRYRVERANLAEIVPTFGLTAQASRKSAELTPLPARIHADDGCCPIVSEIPRPTPDATMPFSHTKIHKRADLERICRSLAGINAPQLPLWRAVADGMISVITINLVDAAWPTKAVEVAMRPVIVLISDDLSTRKGVSHRPQGWACARRLRYWRASSVMVHVAGGELEHRRTAVAATLMGGRLAFVETPSRHAVAWGKSIGCPHPFTVMPRDSLPHPVARTGAVH